MNEDRQIDYDSVGMDEAHVAVAPAELSAALDDALELQPISIRLQKDLLENLKALAKLNGLGYQPLIRQVLTRWVDCELKSMLRERASQMRPEESRPEADAGCEEEMRKAA
ncbi:hypothetical protein [Acidovorax sp. MR-S7]|jgi:uncharacterized protein (DUF4415 family)|uniref:hypothetical protein n=1 Tax=Acidovorax sp. MR-S7 TaxID=1268622 RepID=UPI00036CB450|nr:hypothetical protein [Acidovorax sp. MR-S7]GAD20922.1 hypothetical protein AVS7_00683 [Acidovorax sp. MR-S7]